MNVAARRSSPTGQGDAEGGLRVVSQRSRGPSFHRDRGGSEGVLPQSFGTVWVSTPLGEKAKSLQ